MNQKVKSWGIAFLLVAVILCLVWQFFCHNPCQCRGWCNPLPGPSSCVDFKIIEDSTARVFTRDTNDRIVFDTLFRRDTVYYRCNEWLLDGSHPTAAASRDSLRSWGFCQVRDCPCPGMLELWRYSGNKKVKGIDAGGEVVVDPKKKGNGIGGLDLNYVISFLPPDSIANFTDSISNLELSPNSSVACAFQPVKIAIVDTGVDPLNPPLGWPTSSWSPLSGLTPPCNTSATTPYGLNILRKTGGWEPDDENGHGTHINGIVTGVASHGGDRMGVPFEFLNVKILGSDNSCTLFDAMCGLYYALDQGAEVINISWGFKDTLAPTEVFAPFFQAAKARNVVLVAGMGNDSTDVDDRMKFWPACFADTLSNLISVGALESQTGDLASFSNWSYSGNYITVAAVGRKILSSFPIGIAGNTNGLARMSGTSMATPYVTRTAAVLIGLSKGTGVPYSAQEIKAKIRSTAVYDSAPVYRRLRHGGQVNCPCSIAPCFACGAVQCPLLEIVE